MNRKGTSSKKVIANQQNSMKSTGPTSPAGKSIVRWNALKHGLLSKAVILPSGDGKESQEEFQNLITTLFSQYTPVGTIEEILVEQIAVAYWRKRRVLLADQGEIQKGLSTAENDHWDEYWKDLLCEIDKTNQQYHDYLLEHGKNKTPDSDLYNYCRRNPHGLTHLSRSLEAARKEIEQGRRLSDSSTGPFARLFCGSAVHSVVLSSTTTKKEKLKAIDAEIEATHEWARKIYPQVVERRTAYKNSMQVAGEAATNKLMRYEAAIDRQLYRAIRELRRLQAFRLGLSEESE
jgi:hypothetical protein